MEFLRSVWRTVAHDRRFLILVLVLIESYYVVSLMCLADVAAIEPATLVIKYLIPMAAGGYLLYRAIHHLRSRP